jgi:hypothetical protein
MARSLAAIRVKIGHKPDGMAAYPNFGALAVVAANGMDWSRYVDKEGLGWHYDKTSGHDDDDADSPAGQQWGLLIVPEQFAIEAVAQFPGECTRMTEAECQQFYDDRARVQQADDDRDEAMLTALRAEFNLIKDLLAEFPANTKLQDRSTALKTLLQKALDPDDPHPGVRKNVRRRWATFKARAGITFVEPA